MVKTGLERLLSRERGLLVGKRVALLANPTAVDRRLCHLVDLLDEQGDVNLVGLFGPEHGVRGEAQDMIGVARSRDSLTGLPVHSLYGDSEASLEPTAAMLAGVDTLVYDIQDVGARYYTFVWTLLHALRACAQHGVEVIVLDRPNPLGGDAVEGASIDEGYFSFVGRLPIANRHGMTVGEIARMAKEMEGLDVELRVIPLDGWRRSQSFADTGLPWVMPSPNMPTPSTALVYPGMCLVEGTELSEGRGTTRPFELVGAPFVDGYKAARALADRLAGYGLPGVIFRPVVFEPTFHKHAKTRCGGVQLHVTDEHSFLPFASGVAVLHAFKHMFPDDFCWRTRAYEFVHHKPAIDLLAGGGWLRSGIDAGQSFAALVASYQPAQAAFAERRKAWLLYS